MNSRDAKGHLSWSELQLDAIAPSADDYASAGARATNDGDVLTVICFSIASEEFAIPVSDAVEVIKPRQVAPVPNTPDHISGILCYRGEMLTVVDFGRRLGLPCSAPDADARILVVSCWDIKAGSYVERINRVRDVPKASVRECGKGAENRFGRFVKGILESEGGNIHLLDTYSLVEPDAAYAQ